MFRVMIVEDEVTLRNGLVRLINWTELDCELISVCANGAEALEELSYKMVDIVIADIKMPVMDGLQRCAYLQEHYPAVRKIILSAYAVFQYAQEALKYGVSGYVVKTSMMQELPSLLKKVTADIALQTERQSESASESSMNYIQHLFSSIPRWPQLSSGNAYVLVAAEHSMPADRMQNSIIQYSKAIFADDLLYSTWVSPTRFVHVLVCSGDAVIGSDECLYQTLYRYCESIHNRMAMSLSAGMSLPFTSRAELGQAYEQALEALTHTLDGEYVFEYAKLRNETADELNFDSILEHFLHLLQKDDEVIRSQLLAFFRKNIQSMISYNAARVTLSQLAIQISHLLRGHKEYKAFRTLRNDFIAQINDSQSMQALFDSTCTALLNAVHLFKEKRLNPLVLEANHYIAQHYSEKIRLKDIAAALHINSSYFSRIYKAYTDETVIGYINQYRIRKAKELMMTSNLSITDIATMIGFDDPSYFSPVFVRYTGFLPMQYRNAQSQKEVH